MSDRKDEVFAEMLEALEKMVEIATRRWRPLPPESHEKKVLLEARAAITNAKSHLPGE